MPTSYQKRPGSLIPLISIVIPIITTIVIVAAVSFQKLDLRSRASLNTNEADVIVVGAGTGGVSAALQASRMGASVILLEETDWVGGQMTAAGVTSMDGGNPAWSGGIEAEFVGKIRAYYSSKNKSIGTCYFSTTSTCFEPSVGKRILEGMIAAQPTLSLRLNTQVVSVQKSGNTVTGVVVRQNGSTSALSAKVVIDATEYGDLLPLAGAAYRAGNSTSDNINPNACIQDITYTAVMKKYPNGVPNELNITTPPPGYTADVQKKFATIVAKDGRNTFDGTSYPINWTVHNAYRGMPDSSNPSNYDASNPSVISKTSVNWANDFPVTVKYLEDKAYRKQLNCEAKLETIQFIYYAQHVLGEPLWSVANDEGYDTAYNRDQNSCANIPDSLKAIERNMPPIPYVRESRRAIGVTTLTAKQIKRSGSPATATTTFPSTIAVGDYPTDLHNCMADSTLETSLETKADSSGNGPFEIPMESLIPSTIDGLLVAEKNISQTRLTNGSTRLQPITMITGQAAGALAALAVKSNVPPRNVPAETVQRALLNSQAVLVPFTDVPITDPAFQAIQFMAIRGIMIGTGNLTFSPNQPLTRGQASVIILRAFGIPTSTPSNATYTDVPTTYPFFPYIEGLTKAGFTAGCSTSPKAYCPDRSLTNAEYSVFMLRGWQRKNPSIQPSNTTPGTYTDVPNTFWGYTYVEGLARAGVRWYCDASQKTFCPNATILRKTASIVLRDILYQLIGQQTQTHQVSAQTIPTTTPTPIPTTVPNAKFTIDSGMCRSLQGATHPTETFVTLSACIGRLNDLLQLTQHP